MTWMYLDREVTESDFKGFVAFVYKIQHIASGRTYYGKKRLRKKISRKPLKGKVRRRIAYVESDWRDYWGSNVALAIHLAEEGEAAFTRTILRLCKTLAESSYYEAKYQIYYDVLLHPESYYNEWIMLKVHRTHLKGAK